MFVSPEKIDKLTKEELVDKRVQILFAQEELDAERKQIDERLLKELEMDAEIINDYEVRKWKRTNFDVSLEQARELHAIIKKEAVDTNVLKKLEKAGAKLNKKTIEWITTKPVEG